MSNLLKQCFVVNSTEGKRIINSNRRMEESLMKNESGEHMQQNDASEFDDTKSEKELIPTYEEEKVRLEQLRKEMIADAQTMANQITSTAQSEANGILDAAKKSAQQLFEDQRKLGYEEGKQQSVQELQKQKEQLEQEYSGRKQQLQEEYSDQIGRASCRERV